LRSTPLRQPIWTFRFGIIERGMVTAPITPASMIPIAMAHILGAAGMVGHITGVPGSTFIAMAPCTEHGPQEEKLYASRRVSGFALYE
jgi:hypothetical protein